MITSSEQIQILYEIALTIGEGENLNQSAKKTLSAYLRKLNCSAGAVFLKSLNNSNCYYNIIESIPKRLSKNKVYQSLIQSIPTKQGQNCESFSKKKFPIINTHSDGSTSYLMKLSDLGLLFVVKKGQPFTMDFLYSLNPLNKKFSESLKSFIIKEQNIIHSAALESSSNAVLITDVFGNIEWANPAWTQLNKYEIYEVLGVNIKIIDSTDNKRKSYDEIWEEMKKHSYWDGIVLNQRKDRTKYLAKLKITAVRDLNKDIANYVIVSEDITEQHLFDQRLKENEALLSTIVNTIPDMVWLKDLEGKYVTCNTKFEQFFGAKLEAIRGKTDFDFVSDEMARLFRHYDKVVMDSGEMSVNEEELYFSSDGHYEISETIKTPMRDSDGNIIGILGVSRDISQRKKDQEEVLKSKQRFQDLANLLPQPIWEIDKSGNLIYMNRSGLDLFGLNDGDLNRNFSFFNLFPQKYRNKLQLLLDQDLEDTNEHINIECFNVNSEPISVMIFANEFKHSDINGYRGIILDVSNLKRAESDLISITALQNILIKISTEYINVPLEKIDHSIQEALQEIGVFVKADRSYIFNYDHNNRVAHNTYEWCNEGTEPQIENLQDVPFEMIPQWIDAHFKGDTIYISDVSQLIDKELKEILESQSIKSLIAVPMMHKDICVGFVGFDSVKEYHQYSANEKSTLEVFAQVLVNFQMRTKSEMDLKQAKEKAENAEKAQFNFLSTMSHEIRTPMNAVVGLSNILLMEDPKNEQIHNLKVLKQSSSNLLSIINDILDYNKLISGNVVLESKSFNLNELIKGVYHSMNSLASNKGVDFKYSISSNTPHIVIGDSTRITQILNNLVSNSVKFTKEGSVSLDVKLINKSASNVLLHFSVTDTGIGIPEDKFEDIFEEFKQSSNSITREFGGTGLGLPIVRKLLQVMDSEIYLESEVGKGSVFSFSLELQVGGADEELLDESDIVFDDSLYRMKVLVVEDNKINQMVVHRFLTEWKCKIEIAENGQIAVDKIKEKQYDIVLMDLHMPVMDGYTATNEIRKLKDPLKSQIPIVALSASALGEIEVRARKFGMDAFVTKPFVPQILFKTLKKFRSNHVS